MARRGISTIIVCAILLLISANCLNADSNQNAVSDAINNFGIQLYKELTKTNKNLVCSGYSAATVLNMLLVGAGTSTAQELRTTLGYDAKNLTENQIEDAYHQILTEQRNHNSLYVLDVANSMWIQSGFKVLSSYTSTITNTFYALEQQVDFSSPAATNQINSWVNKETHGKIPKLFDSPLGDDIRVVLVNAMFLNATWVMPFEKYLTSKYPFKNGNSQTPTQMMNLQSYFNYGSSKTLNAKLLEMPYNGNDLSMVIVLPNTVDGLGSLESQLTLQTLNAAINGLSNTLVAVKMPKFKITSSLPLNQQLQDLGMQKTFVAGEADLSGIDGQRDLYLSFVIQKALIEVNEDGTVAAVATGGGVGAAGVVERPPPIPFIADHPFLYLIRHKPTGLFLFMGRLTQP